MKRGLSLQQRCDNLKKQSNSTRLQNNNRKPTTVLSWDCGISNLCYCILEEIPGDQEFRVKIWENFSLNSQTLKEATSMLVKELNKRSWLLDVDYICIENQVLKNVSMKVICHNLQCYFETHIAQTKNLSRRRVDNEMYVETKKGPEISFIKADSKFLVATSDKEKLKKNPQMDFIQIPDKIEKLQRRRRNKQAAVYIAKEILRRKSDTTALKFLNSFTKQDDLSDSLLQGLYFLRNLKKKRENHREIQRHLGIPFKDAVSISIEDKKKIGTMDEIFEEEGTNEGCEYEKEVLLPQIYRSVNYVPVTYHDTKSDISGATKFVREQR